MCLEVTKPELGDLPMIIATLKDGEVFGRLTLGEGCDTVQRPATCITVEDTDVLMIKKSLAQTIMNFPVPRHVHEELNNKHSEETKIKFLTGYVKQF